MKPALLVFDFDGVVADSELLANSLLAEFLTLEGRPTTLTDSMRLFMGRRASDNRERMAAHLGRPLSADFEERLRAHSSPRMHNEVAAVTGAEDFIRSHSDMPMCIASSSSHFWLAHMTGRLGLGEVFAGRMFSGTEVSNGKPAPDLFLLAADRMGVDPKHALVIEDSPAGIIGARAAGMTTIGLLAGAHIRDGHDVQLRQAGAHHIAKSYDDVAALIAGR